MGLEESVKILSRSRISISRSSRSRSRLSRSRKSYSRNRCRRSRRRGLRGRSKKKRKRIQAAPMDREIVHTQLNIEFQVFPLTKPGKKNI